MGDEPTGALNRAAATQVLNLLGQVHARGRALVLVTHDPQVAARADRVLALVDGAVAADLRLGAWDTSPVAERAERSTRVSRLMAGLGV